MRWRRPASRVDINDVNDGRAHRIALLVIVSATRDDDRRGYDEDEGGGGDDVGIVPSSRVRRCEYDDDNDDYCIATIRDDGILVVPFPNDAKMATFWGRKSESGNGMHDMPEPCQCDAA